MKTALDRRRGALAPSPPRDFVKGAAKVMLELAWHSRGGEGRFAQRPEKAALERLYVQADDGWTCPMFRLPLRPGASGEPVILAHGLGINRHSMDFDAERSLARALQAAGFAVFLWENRADRSAIAPPEKSSFDADDIAGRDLPAAIDAARSATGATRVLFCGHALGGQLLYLWLGQGGAPDLAAATTIGSAVRFDPPASGARRLALARQLLPPQLRLPTRAASALASPWADTDSLGSDGERTRGLLVHGGEDLHGGLLRQVMLWVETGALCDRADSVDLLAALEGVDLPLQVFASLGDPLCRPDQAAPVLESLAGPRELHTLDETWGHLDALIGPRSEECSEKVVSWLNRFRDRCWS